MNIFYWSVANLLHSNNIQNQDEDFYQANKNASIAFIVAYSAYGLIRFFFNRIGGLYMFKRLLIAAILAGAVYRKGLYVILILGLELVFVVSRFLLERPKSKC
jgi:hypothetical protein